MTLLGARLLRAARPYRISLIFVGVTLWRLARPRRQHALSQTTDPKHIVVVRLDALGDLVMTTLVFRELKLRFPHAVVTAVIQGSSRAILESSPYVDRICSPPRSTKSMFAYGLRQDLSILKLYRTQLRHTSVDLVVNPRLDEDRYSADVLLKLLDPPRTYKYEDLFKKGIAAITNKFAFREATTLSRPAPRHEVLNTMAITEAITGTVCTSRPELFLTKEDVAYSAELLKHTSRETTVVCIAFGAQAMRRVWPIERWAEVIHLLTFDRSVSCIIACTASEAKVGRQLQALIKTPCSLLAGSALRQLAATMQACDLFMGPDSGPAHLAAAVACPSVIVSPHPLSGSLDHGNSPLRFGPFSDSAIIVQPEHGLAPCSTGCDAVTPHCILQVSASQVAQACSDLLDRTFFVKRSRRSALGLPV